MPGPDSDSVKDKSIEVHMTLIIHSAALFFPFEVLVSNSFILTKSPEPKDKPSDGIQSV